MIQSTEDEFQVRTRVAASANVQNRCMPLFDLVLRKPHLISNVKPSFW